MMVRTTLVLLAFSVSLSLVACSGEPAPEAKSPEPAKTAAKPDMKAAQAPAAPAPVAPAVTPKPAPETPKIREKPSEEACKLACKKILGLAVAKVPEIRRRGAQSFMDAVVDEACPDKCMRSGTRASVACVNAAETYEDAKGCSGTL